MKDPAPLASARMLVVLAVTALIYFTCTLALKVVFNISILDIHPNNPKLPLMTCIFGIGGIVYWRITRKYTEKYVSTILTPKFQGSKYNKRVKGWMIIVACLLCFFVLGISASVIV
ncbi:hypothetical protein [Porphyromonas loveana]|nr:hypothetical protein [Porphyromonas loveana]